MFFVVLGMLLAASSLARRSMMGLGRDLIECQSRVLKEDKA